jgi:hypothetical protein
VHSIGTDAEKGASTHGAIPAFSAFTDNSAGEYDAVYLGLITCCVSVLAFLYFFRQGEILLYGDATSHIHIARRVLDSRTPGLDQLGTVWLPLPHLLMIPFVFSHSAWQTGIGGSIPSMLAFVFGALGVFRLVRGALPKNAAARFAAWFAAIVYVANPNLLYLQATAMTEPLYLALFIWATVYFSEFVQATRETGEVANLRRSRKLSRCGWMLFGAMLTRYDGWFTAAVFVLVAFIVLWIWTGNRAALWRSPLRPVFTRFLIIVALAPVFWFVYNTIYWGNPLEFATGPYSAQAIEARSDQSNGWHHPGWHAPKTAALYFLKTAKLNMAGGAPQQETKDAPAPRWRLENAWLPLALLGAGLMLAGARGCWPLLLLWVPLPFYALSIAWGSVPIFLPAWWPFSYYNVRYGLQLLPALAVFTSFVIYFAGVWTKSIRVLIGVTVLLGMFVAGSYAVAMRHTPICLREARVNSAARILFDRKLAEQLQQVPPGSTLLMYTSGHAAALEFAGLPLRRTINEGNKKVWYAALASPARVSDYVLAFEAPDDPVWQAVQRHQDDLQSIAIIESPGHPRAWLFQRR